MTRTGVNKAQAAMSRLFGAVLGLLAGLVQSPTWKLGAVSISIPRRQFDKTYVAVAFGNQGRAVTLNFIVVNGPDGWVISDVESPRDSLRMFLAQYRN
jgi:hypothetical protein